MEDDAGSKKKPKGKKGKADKEDAPGGPGPSESRARAVHAWSPRFRSEFCCGTVQAHFRSPRSTLPKVILWERRFSPWYLLDVAITENDPKQKP